MDDVDTLKVLNKAVSLRIRDGKLPAAVEIALGSFITALHQHPDSLPTTDLNSNLGRAYSGFWAAYNSVVKR